MESAWTAFGAADEVVATQEKALELARESVTIAQVSYENGVITSAELNDAQVRLLQTEWLLMQAKYSRILAAARRPRRPPALRRQAAVATDRYSVSGPKCFS